MKYDVLYQEWLEAKRNKDYDLADSIREQFERYHGLTIFAEGPMPIEGVTVSRMPASKWYKKYDNPKVGEIIAAWDSKVKMKYPEYTFLPDQGYHY